MAKYLYSEDQCVVVLDGTYRYIQKSSNFEFQRLSYSGQKKRNLYKPFFCVTTTGKIISVFGPFTANTSDAKIIKEVIELDVFEDLFETGDYFLVDRGFRDSITVLESKGFVTLMPSFLEKNKSQLSTLEANKSRLCTKQRGIVERVFGRLRSHFKYFANRSQNKSLKTDFRDLLNVCSVLNAYFPPIISDSGYKEEISNRLK